MIDILRLGVLRVRTDVEDDIEQGKLDDILANLRLNLPCLNKVLHFSRRRLAYLIEDGRVREETLDILLLDCLLEELTVCLRVRLCLACWPLPTLLRVSLWWRRRGTILLLLSVLALGRTLTVRRTLRCPSWVSLIPLSTSAGLNS